MARKIKQKDFHRLIEIAYQLDKSEKGFNINDVKETARELGISEDKIDKAYDILEEEKKSHFQQKKRQQKRWRRGLSLLGLVALVVSVAYYINRPKIFTGRVQMILGDRLEGNQPVNTLEKVSLFKYSKVISYVRIDEMNTDVTLQWRFYEPSGKLHDTQSLQTVKSGPVYTAYAELLLPLSTPVGKWRIELYADERPITQDEFIVEFSDYAISFASGINEHSRPLGLASTFKRSQHPRIYCHMQWNSLGRNGTLKWKWYNPQGEQADVMSFTTQATAEGESYLVYAFKNPPEMEPGPWRVELLMDDIKFAEQTVTLE